MPEKLVEIYDPEVDAFRQIPIKDLKKIVEKGKEAERILKKLEKGGKKA